VSKRASLKNSQSNVLISIENVKHGVGSKDTKRPFSLDLVVFSLMVPIVTGYPRIPMFHSPLRLHLEPLDPLA
jgi:hypothetical protein